MYKISREYGKIQELQMYNEMLKSNRVDVKEELGEIYYALILGDYIDGEEDGNNLYGQNGYNWLDKENQEAFFNLIGLESRPEYSTENVGLSKRKSSQYMADSVVLFLNILRKKDGSMEKEFGSLETKAAERIAGRYNLKLEVKEREGTESSYQKLFEELIQELSRERKLSEEELKTLFDKDYVSYLEVYDMASRYIETLEKKGYLKGFQEMYGIYLPVYAEDKKYLGVVLTEEELLEEYKKDRKILEKERETILKSIVTQTLKNLMEEFDSNEVRAITCLLSIEEDYNVKKIGTKGIEIPWSRNLEKKKSEVKKMVTDLYDSRVNQTIQDLMPCFAITHMLVDYSTEREDLIREWKESVISGR